MAFWTDAVDGGLIHSTSSSYREYTLTGPLQLDWPLESARDEVIADSMFLSAATPGTVTMPDAKKGSTGGVCEICNDGLADITVKDFAGGTIITIAPSSIYRFILRDNTTPAGVWRAIGMGSATTVAHASSLASETIVAKGTTLVQAMPVLSISTNYTVGAGERGKLINWTGGSGTLTLTQPTTLGDNWFTHVRHSGDGVLDVAAGPFSAIDGSASITFAPGQSAIIVCTGTAFYTISRASSAPSGGGGSSEPVPFTLQQINVAGSGDYVLSADQLGASAYRFFNTLTGNRTIIVPTSLAAYWVRNETSGPYTLTVKTAAGTGIIVPPNASKILYSNGTNVVDAATPGISVPLGITEGGTGSTSASAARTALGATSLGNTLFTAATTSAAKSALALTKTDVGLANVDNTSDAAKPISTAVATALAGKQASGSYAALGGSNSQQFNVSDLWINSRAAFVTTLLDAKQSVAGMAAYAPLNGGTGTPFYASDFYLNAHGNWISNLLNAKQAALGYTPAPLNGALNQTFYASSFITDGTTSGATIFERNGGPPLYIDRIGDTGVGIQFRWSSSHSNVGSISINGSSVSFNTTSDERLKEDFQDPRAEVDAFFDALHVYDYRWKATGHRFIGPTAQELYGIEPRAVTEGETRRELVPRRDADGVMLRDDNGDLIMEEVTVYSPWGVDHSKLVPHALVGIQMLREKLALALARIEELEAKVG